MAARGWRAGVTPAPGRPAVGRPADSLTVMEELERRGLLDQIGGHTALTHLVDSCPSDQSNFATSTRPSSRMYEPGNGELVFTQ